MGFLSAVGNVFRVLKGPVDVLVDWAKEPLKRWENDRNEANKDRDVERDIRRQTDVEKVKSQLRMEEAKAQADLEIKKKTEIQRINAEAEQRTIDQEFQRSQLRMEEAKAQADLEIKMQTEIQRINAETEQWTKDQEFQRMKDVAEAVCHYRERLTQLQLNTIRAIGNMDIELREKAQNLILTKTREYKALQDQAQKDAEAEFERILDKFSNNERMMDILITSAQKKLASVIDGASQFLAGLNDDIMRMNSNIDLITQQGQKFIDAQISTRFEGLAPAQNDPNLLQQ